MLTNTNDLIADFVRVAMLSGLSIIERDIAHQTLRAPHTQPTLPDNSQAVYVFSLSNLPFTVLKVGKVGPNSNARFQSQHYNPNSAGSNLAKSLLNQKDVWEQLGIQSLTERNVGEWIRKHTDRDHFFLSANQAALCLSLLEVVVQCRLHPVFEG